MHEGEVVLKMPVLDDSAVVADSLDVDGAELDVLPYFFA